MLILASASPRRHELMEIITHDFRVVSSDADETLATGMRPGVAVEALALRKAQAVAAQYPGDVIIGADTVVALGNQLLGKPRDNREAAAMLKLLSGRKHSVYTGVAVVSAERENVFHERTGVQFIEMTAEQIDAYVASGEPMDKAGAYGIQGRGALYVAGIEGDYYSVMGLPVCRLALVLSEIGAV